MSRLWYCPDDGSYGMGEIVFFDLDKIDDDRLDALMTALDDDDTQMMNLILKAVGRVAH